MNGNTDLTNADLTLRPFRPADMRNFRVALAYLAGGENIDAALAHLLKCGREQALFALDGASCGWARQSVEGFDWLLACGERERLTGLLRPGLAIYKQGRDGRTGLVSAHALGSTHTYRAFLALGFAPLYQRTRREVA